MYSVKSLMTRKQHKKILWISPYDSVATAIQKMSDNDLESLPIIEHGELVGMFSEHQYIKKLLECEKSIFLTLMFEVMDSKIVYVTPDYSLMECLALMTRKHIRSMPVLDKEKFIYLLSIDEVIHALLQDKDFAIASLTQYLSDCPTLDVSSQASSFVRELVLDKSGKQNGETSEQMFSK